MSHEITNTDTMFSGNRVTPWHGLGVVIDGTLTSAEAIEVAGLGWTVGLAPLAAAAEVDELVWTEDGPEDRKVRRLVDVPNHFATVRSDNAEVLGVVGRKYRVVQNHEAFSFMDSLVEGHELHFETAGSLRGGRIVWMLAKRPEGILIAGEETDMYLALTNGHAGNQALRAMVTPVRIVCKNTLNAGLKQAQSVWSIRHTASIKGRMEDAKRTLQLTDKYLAAFKTIAERWALETVSRDQAISTLNRVWRPKGEDVLWSDETGAILANLELSPTIRDEDRNTKLGVWHAATEWMDWKQDFRKSSSRSIAEQRVERAMDTNIKPKTALAAALSA